MEDDELKLLQEAASSKTKKVHHSILRMRTEVEVTLELRKGALKKCVPHIRKVPI